MPQCVYEGCVPLLSGHYTGFPRKARVEEGDHELWRVRVQYVGHHLPEIGDLSCSARSLAHVA